jgi:signal transduction histidine kinase/DNA-binding NarL/FixJ family response regulator/HPt (histidine-containing phosphotransfer) domain-containing protein
VTELHAPTAPRPPPTKRWLWLIVGMLLTALAIVAGVQWRQFSLLNASVRYEGDNIVWSFFQLEVEYLKLRGLLRDVEQDPARLDRDALQTRLDLFVSRVALVEPRRTQAQIATQPIQSDTVARIQAFVARADALLGSDPDKPLAPAVPHALLAQLEPLAAPVHDMAMWANEAMAAQVGARSELVRQQSRISIAMVAFQLLMTVAFAAIVLRQLRALEQRSNALERLAGRLQVATSDAEAASRTKSAFLANMSHELRTPFQGVLGMLALIEDGPLNDQQADQLRTARESAQHLLALLNDVLDVSTLEHGQVRLVPTPTALPRLVAEVEALMRGPALSKGLALRVQRVTEVPGFVLVDATRLKQILFNLLGNAIKFTDTGAVVMEVGVEQDPGGPPQMCFKVIDSGIGMDEPTLARLFKRFSQGDDSTLRRFGGTGLGLEISRSLARMMEGDITVHSAPGLGSSFVLRVPLPVCDAPTAGAGLHTGAAMVTPPLRVLVAEDHPINRKYLEALLARMGHTVTLCENGELAAQAAAGQDFDVVLMDMHMPVMDGFAATQAIRALPAPRGVVPVFALTADAFAETRERAARAGMNDFLPKPVQPAELKQALNRMFGRPVIEGAAAAQDAGLSVSPAGAVRPSEMAPAGRSTTARPARASSRSDPPEAAHAKTPAHNTAGDSASAPVPWLDRMAPEVIFGDLPPDTHATFLNDFFEDDSGTIARLSQRLDGRADRALRQAAHAVKGVAMNLGLTRLANTAAVIETLPSDTSAAQIQALHDRLFSELAQSRVACLEAGWIETPAVDTEPA